MAMEYETTNKIQAFIKSLDMPIIILLPREYLLKRGIFIKGQSAQYIYKDYLKCQQPLSAVREYFVNDLERIISKDNLLGRTIVIDKESVKTKSRLLREKCHESFHFLWEQFNGSNDVHILILPIILTNLYFTRLNDAEKKEIEGALLLDRYSPEVKAQEFWAHFMQTQYSIKKENMVESETVRILKDRMNPDWPLRIKAQDFYESVFSFFENLPSENDLCDKVTI